MFKKKMCSRCGRKVSEKYEFCPYCGNLLNENSKEVDWGMLGKNDIMPSLNGIKFPMGLNVIFNSLMKNLDKQFKNLDKRETKMNPWKNKGNKNGVSISISTSGNRPPKIRVNSFGNDSEFKQKEQNIKKQIKEMPTLSQGSLKKFSSLPREEPSTNIRRLSDKVIYEINMPGIKSIKDISIIKLENSLEIKALAKDKSYFKLISISLPIINYNLLKEKLVLEFGVKG